MLRALSGLIPSAGAGAAGAERHGQLPSTDRASPGLQIQALGVSTVIFCGLQDNGILHDFRKGVVLKCGEAARMLPNNGFPS